MCHIDKMPIGWRHGRNTNEIRTVRINEYTYRIHKVHFRHYFPMVQQHGNGYLQGLALVKPLRKVYHTA